MSGRAHIRVENRKTNGSFEDRKKGFDNMLRAFRKACGETKILNELKKYEFYEKPSAKRHRKKVDLKRQLERERNMNNKRGG
jgi:ribosomal protein S21